MQILGVLVNIFYIGIKISMRAVPSGTCRSLDHGDQLLWQTLKKKKINRKNIAILFEEGCAYNRLLWGPCKHQNSQETDCDSHLGSHLAFLYIKILTYPTLSIQMTAKSIYK